MLKSIHSSSRSAKKRKTEKKPSARLTEAPVQSQDAKTVLASWRSLPNRVALQQ